MVRETSLPIRLMFSVEESETPVSGSLWSTMRTSTHPLKTRRVFPSGELKNKALSNTMEVGIRSDHLQYLKGVQGRAIFIIPSVIQLLDLLSSPKMHL